jgi:hypothetical protein
MAKWSSEVRSPHDLLPVARELHRSRSGTRFLSAHALAEPNILESTESTRETEEWSGTKWPTKMTVSTHMPDRLDGPIRFPRLTAGHCKLCVLFPWALAEVSNLRKNTQRGRCRPSRPVSGVS